MKLPSLRVVRTFPDHVWHRVGIFLFTFVFAGILLVSITTSAKAVSVVRFDLNYSVDVGTSSIDYFDVELYDTAAPITVENFLTYVNDGLYNNTIIHRDVKQNFSVVQGGGFTPVEAGGEVTELKAIKTYDPIQNEYSDAYPNAVGTISMARSSNPDSATSQWFVNVSDNSDAFGSSNTGGYAVFGKVLGDGMTLINAINDLTIYNKSAQYGSTFTEVPMFDNGTSFVTIKSASVLPPPATATTGKLSGFLYYDKNQNGVMDGDDYPIVGALVSLMRAGSSTPVATGYSRNDGSYNFSNLGVGTYSVKMAASALSNQDNGGSQIILDKDGNIVSTGTTSQNSIALDEDQTGKNFNVALSAYPVSLLSARMLLSSSVKTQHADAAAVPSTNTDSGSILNFGSVLVGSQGNKTLTVSNTGVQGSELTGTFPGASGVFDSAGNLAYGPLGSGQAASQEYTYAPTTRESNAQDINVTSNAGNMKVTLSGTGVAPIQSVINTAADAGLVRIGTTGTASITIKNIGDGNLSGVGDDSNLKGTVAAGSGSFTGTGGSISLSDNAQQVFDYIYTPTAHASDSITIATNFSNGSTDGKNIAEIVNTDLSGQGVGPKYSSVPAPDSTLDFGSVAQEDLTSLFLEITNASTDANGDNTELTDLTILDAEITGADAGLFSIVGLTNGTVLHEGESLNLEIAYNGTGDHGDRTALLTISTDEGAALGVAENSFTYDIKASLAPEPSTLVMLAMGGLFIGGLTWRRRTIKRG
jgi:cyclophilin family peptidyl-prolyl cis-trans isomerase